MQASTSRKTAGPIGTKRLIARSQQRVKEAIYRDPSLKDEGIGVETHLGTVRLTGAVSSILVMEKAIEVVRGVKGVREVQDGMQFRWQY